MSTPKIKIFEKNYKQDNITNIAQSNQDKTRKQHKEKNSKKRKIVK